MSEHITLGTKEQMSISAIQDCIGRTIQSIEPTDWDTSETRPFETPLPAIRETFHPIIVRFSDGHGVRFYSEVSNESRLTAEPLELRSLEPQNMDSSGKRG
ncbi:hypothetical protein, partial [Gordonia malaquae]|uniref:hypothetical protein n=1 Tax=Gordonia malaquae TaxID=410332 RepID=UPI001C3F40AC